jgi:glycosyltransferase involved in cell wall biosynthesis
MVDGIRYRWIKTPKYQASGIGRIFNIIVFVIKSMYYTKRISKEVNPDFILVASTYVLDIYPAYLIARKCRAKLVYELHDLWPLSPMIIGGYSKYHPFIALVQRAENFACLKSDYFISLLGNAKDYLVSHGMKPGKFIYVPNGYPLDEQQAAILPVPEEHRQLFEKLKDQSKIIVGYAGGYAPSNALASLINAAILVPDNLNLAYILVGNGQEKERLIELAKDLENIHFLPSISKVVIPDFLSQCDILYAGGISSTLHNYGTAFNKVTDYMLAGKPIVFAVDDPNSLVEKVGCGVQVPAERPEDIAAVITHLADLNPSERRVMGMKGKVYAEKELGYTSIAQKILESIGVQ